MQSRPITENYSVSPQITPEEVADCKRAGFRSIICNRPDNEQPGQPSAASIRAAAEAAGLEFRFVPVISGQMSATDVEEMSRALEELPGPVLAYCRSGTRCTILFAAVQNIRG